MNRIPRFTSILIALVLLIGTGCKHDGPDPVEISDYPLDIAEIVINNFATSGCHVDPGPPADLTLTTWDAAMRGSDFGAVLIPGSPEWSHFIQHINTYEDLGIRATPVMPPDSFSAPLSREKVEQVKAWIEGGAKNVDGQGRWDAQEQSSDGKLFTLCAGSDLVAVTDISTNLLMRMIPVGQYPDRLEAPHYIRISPDNQYFYVTLIEGGIVEKYRTDNYEFIGRVEVMDDPALIQINPNGTRAVISHYNDLDAFPKLTMLNLDEMSIVDQVVAGLDLINRPHGMATNSDFTILYVVANGGNYYAKWQIDEDGFIDHEEISIDPENSPSPRNTIDYKPYDCKLNPEGTQFYISCSEKDEVRVISTNNDSLLAVIPVGEFPRLMEYDPATNRLFVACANQENFPVQGSIRGCVAVINTETLAVEKLIYRLGQRPHGLGIDPVSRKLYVSSENVGGADPPHHPLEGVVGTPGKYNVVNLNTLEVLRDYETEVAVFPNALVVSP